jgi:hypothetical protein
MAPIWAQGAEAAVPSVVKLVLTPSGNGAYILRSDGTVTGLGNATSHGGPPALAAGEQVTTILPSANGYLLFTNLGRAFAFGDAVKYGDLTGLALNGGIVDVAATVDGKGYWMLGADGGVFTFGTAQFSGSTGNMALNSPANGLVPDKDGRGYRFVAGDGGVFAFDAPFLGSMGAAKLNKPVVGMIPYGNGYLMVASDGGVFTFADKAFYGSIGATPLLTTLSPVVSIAAGPAGDWYVLARADGALFPFGPGVPPWIIPTPITPGVGNPNGTAVVPPDGQAVDTSHPTRIIGNGSPASCTSAAVVSAVAQGGILTFNCGPDPITITLEQTAKVFNNTGPDIVIDGGGKVTLSGGGQRRILYMDTCDPAQVWTTSHCQDQDHPRLTVQNLTLANGNSTGETYEGGGGGAIFDRGGRLKIVNSRFVSNVCDPTGPDLGGAAVRALSQSQGLPIYVVNSTFGGSASSGNICSNGGALSSIGVSWIVLNSVLTFNQAIGQGANPASPNTPGGGSGGAIYNDGNYFTVRIAGSIVEDNIAREGGGAVFFVSNDHTGTLTVEDSTLRRNPSQGFETAGYPGIFFLGLGHPTVINSTLQ